MVLPGAPPHVRPWYAWDQYETTYKVLHLITRAREGCGYDPEHHQQAWEQQVAGGQVGAHTVRVSGIM